MALLKTLPFILIVPGFVAGYLPYQIALATLGTLPLGLLRYAAIPAWLIGGAGLLWCAWDFAIRGQGTPAPTDPPRVLVVYGLYRFVRNPMYVSVLLIVLGHALWFETFWVLVYAASLFLAFHAFVVLYEEPALRRRFGQAYVDYGRAVPRWLPRPNLIKATTSHDSD